MFYGEMVRGEELCTLSGMRLLLDSERMLRCWNSLRLRARQQKSAEKVAIKRLLPAPHWMNWDLLPLTIC